MIKISDFTDENDKVDWEGYRKAQRENGEICTRCGTYILRMFNDYNGPSKCLECKQLDKPEELDHSSLMRCPACGESWDPYEADDYQVYEEGEHDVSCQHCNHDFKVTTRVSYTFTSPARI